MKKFRIAIGATALALVAASFIACNKEKEMQHPMLDLQRAADHNDLTLAEMADAMSWEEGKVFFENQPIRDYTAVCEKVLNDCGIAEKSSSSPTYVFGWHWATPEEDCISEYKGICFGIKQDPNSSQSNVMCYFEDGKLVIVPVDDENGFTTDGYLVVGTPIEVQNDSIVIESGIYAAYYDEEEGKYVAVAVDYSIIN